MTTPPSPLPFELPPVTIVSRQTGRVLVQFPSSPLGYKTVQVYEFLNRAAYPKVALLYSDDDKPAEIYYKPRLGGGEYSVAFVPSYGPHINPFQLIQNKVLFKNLKRENRRHDSQRSCTGPHRAPSPRSPEGSSTGWTKGSPHPRSGAAYLEAKNNTNILCAITGQEGQATGRPRVI
jgi:hypothetical protein